MSSERAAPAEEALLMQLAELGMGLVRRLNEVAQATRDVEALVAIAAAYHQVGRGVRQSLALGARFAAGTVAAERPARIEAASQPPASRPRPETERADWSEYERPDWTVRAEPLDVGGDEPLDPESVDGDVETCVRHIRRDLTVVSRTPALAAIPALRPIARTLAGRAALLGGASLRVVNSS